ncbi:SusC/RagA family TonB-linked outer membrane protein [Pedobacter sp. AW31-3R]|uniref:SusC/RagA family TonB-linked outer membrane protein n=1 Tax=Pedobacter sp. AW31-3R TaxID=3445781 RepID=UPI003FA09C89
MRQKATLFIICLLCGISVAFAQNINIKGEVKDQQGLPLPGVSVKVKGSTQGVITNGDGSYVLSAPANATLTFSFIGFKTIEEAINKRTTITVTLSDDNQQLNEVVVVGYGTQTKKDITTAVVSVSSKDIQNQPITNPMQALQGKAAGVQVNSQSGKPGAGISISIRGNTSITASNSPLYVIDGVTSRDAAFLNPNDIESMTILKDASAAAIYGSSGANGVVLITTKKGKEGKLKVGFNAFTGFSNFWKDAEMLNKDQYIDLMNELGREYGAANTDWQKETFGTGTQSSYQVSLSGGVKGGQYYFSSGYQQDKGVVAPAKLDRLTMNFTGSQNVTKWLKFTANAALTSNKSIDVADNAGAARGGVILSALTTPPTITILEPNGSYTPAPGGYENPIGNAFGATNSNRQFRFIGAFGGEIKFSDDLIFKSTISTNINRGYYNYFTDPYKTIYGRTERGLYRNNRTNDRVWLNENILTYNKTLGKNVLGATAGYTLQSSRYLYQVYSQSRYIDANTGAPIEPTIAAAVPDVVAPWSKQSYLGRFTYAYDSKYLFSSNFRADGSSRFAKVKRFGYFPSFSAGWRISGENFMKDSKIINDLKLRGSWGQVGNDEGIGDFSHLQLFQLASQGSYALSQFANEDLSWEKTTQTNIGLDLTLFNSRVTFTADAYMKKTNQLLINVQLPPSTGLGTQALNVGSMENKGLEFALSTKNIQNDKFTWSTDMNISFNRNKVTSLGETTANLDFGGIYERTSAVRTVVGRPLGSFYGLLYKGVNPENGDAIFEDFDQNGTIDANDRTFIGSAQPKFNYGITNTLTYGNWGLNVFFQGVQGNQIFNASRIETEGLYDTKNQSIDVLNRWTTPGQITNIPKAANSTDNSQTSSRFVENGSYLRLKTATFSYNFGATTLGKWKMDKLTVFATGYNLLTFTKYSGLDPEVNQYESNGPNMGVDYGTYPQSRTFLFGVNVGF